MPTLLEVQQSMRRSLFGGAERSVLDGDASPSGTGAPASPDAADPAPLVVPGLGAAALERLSIHRNTARSALLNALRLSFPVVQRLVGETFFEGAAQCFIDEAPGGIPDSACLYDYGTEFAGFLESFPPAAELPYLGDVARLEWAVNRALHAPDAERLDAARIGSLLGGRADAHLVLHASIGLLSLRYPADTIWRALIEGDDSALAAVDLASGPVWLLIERDEADGVQVERLRESAWRFSQRLCVGLPLFAALDEVRAGGESGDSAAVLLAEHLSARRFIGVALLDEDPRGDPRS
jgi:hypothetical protein